MHLHYKLSVNHYAKPATSKTMKDQHSITRTVSRQGFSNARERNATKWSKVIEHHGSQGKKLKEKNTWS